MAIDSSVYTDPGVYQQEVIVPNVLASGQIPTLMAIIGTAPRVRRISNEAKIRGSISNESLTLAGSIPHTATLVNKGDRNKSNTQIIRNGVDILPPQAYTYRAATVTGGAGPYTVAASSFLTFSLDKRGYISVALTSGSRTAAQLAAEINVALVGDSRYGTAYATAASDASGALRLTSQRTDTGSDLRVIATPAVTGTSAHSVVLGVTVPYRAPVTLEILDEYYSATATYVISYVALDTEVDSLSQANATKISRVGLFAGVTSFTPTVDWIKTSNTIDWSPGSQATITGPTGPFNTTTLTGLRFALNGLPAVTVALTSGAARTSAQIAAELNTALVGNSSYGPLYGAVFTDSSGKLQLTTPSPFLDEPLARGKNSSIEFFDTPNNTSNLLFGVAAAQLPFNQVGVGDQPVFGSTYFISYDAARPTSDYNNPSAVDHKFVRVEDALAYTGPLTSDNVASNQLAQAVKIAFENDAPQVVLVQINDLNMPGQPSINEVIAAIDATKGNSEITEVCLLDTRTSTVAYLLNHVTNESSFTVKHYRRGWYGAARNTAIGSIDTADTLVYRAQVTLAVPPDSPGRGRQILTAPANVSKTYTLEDGSERRVLLSSAYLAVATCARQCSFVSVATSLLRKSIVGFNLDDFQIYTDVERRTLASNGVNVVTVEGGRFVLTDPVTTEQGAGNMPSFIEISTGVAKDKITRNIDKALYNNGVGIVPSDLADFINDIKGIIASVLTSSIGNGDIAAYTDSSLRPRDINLLTDIQVSQNPQNKTQYNFRYYYNLRYPAKRFFGEYSVDNPFFQSGGAAAPTA